MNEKYAKLLRMVFEAPDTANPAEIRETLAVVCTQDTMDEQHQLTTSDVKQFIALIISFDIHRHHFKTGAVVSWLQAWVVQGIAAVISVNIDTGGDESLAEKAFGGTNIRFVTTDPRLPQPVARAIELPLRVKIDPAHRVIGKGFQLQRLNRNTP